MDLEKNSPYYFAYENKDTDIFTKLPLLVIGMLTHRYGDVRYAHYMLDLYPGNCKHAMGSFVRFLCDLEEPLVSSFLKNKISIYSVGCSPLYPHVLHGSEMCLQGLQAPSMKPIPAILLPPILHAQFDSCWKDNKCRFMKAFWSMFAMKWIFTEVHMFGLLIDHTHDDIEASFERWNMNLYEHDHPTIPLLMESNIDMEGSHYSTYDRKTS